MADVSLVTIPRIQETVNLSKPGLPTDKCMEFRL
jgi:hypothetical protein